MAAPQTADARPGPRPPWIHAGAAALRPQAPARTSATAPGRSPVHGILFDKDGTLFDFHRTWGAWACDLAAAEAGGDRALATALAEALGLDAGTGRLQADSLMVACTDEMIADRLRPLLPPAARPGLLARVAAGSAAATQVEAAPLAELLGALARAGLTLGVATNDTEAGAWAHLRAAGVEGAFGFVAGCDSGWGSKPDPGQLLAFARATGLDPASCVMVGDGPHDLLAARAAGMAGVAVLTGTTGREALEPLADVVLDSVAGLPGWLARP